MIGDYFLATVLCFFIALFALPKRYEVRVLLVVLYVTGLVLIMSL